MPESEKSIEQLRNDFFRRVESLDAAKRSSKIQLSKGQNPIMVSIGTKELNKRPDTDMVISEIEVMNDEDRNKVYKQIFGEKAVGMSEEAKGAILRRIANADRMLLHASMLITEHQDSFPGVDTGLLKKFFEGYPDTHSVAAYDELKRETLLHYGVRDLEDYSGYAGYMMDRLAGNKKDDQK